MAALDAALAPLLESLDADAERFETHLLVTADHGESLGGDGSIGHGSRLTAEQLRVPLVLVSPRGSPGRRRDVAGSVDLFATVLGLAGLPSPRGAGRDLVGPPPSGGGRAFGMANLSREGFDVRTDGRVLGTGAPRFYAAKREALVTGDADGVRLGDRGAELEGRGAAEAAALFAGFARELSRAPVAELRDEETERALEALGYAR